MNIDLSYKKFLIFKTDKEGLCEKSFKQYENKLHIFRMYLFDKKYKISKESDNAFDNIDLQVLLEKLTIEDIFESLYFYIELRGIEFENTARHYITVLKEYFRYIYGNMEIKNKSLFDSFGFGDKGHELSFDKQVDNKMKELIKLGVLKYKKEIGHIDEKDYEKLLKYCNKNLEFDNILEDFNVYNSKYTDFLCAIVIKLILFTGIKFGVIYTIKVNDFEFDKKILKLRSKVNINKKSSVYNIEIPESLSNDLFKYLNVSNKIRKEGVDSFFVMLNGTPVNDNTTFNKFIGDAIRVTSSTAALSKYVVIEMILKKMNQHLIQDFTSNGNTIFEYCQEIANDIKGQGENKSNYINSNLKRLEYYNLF
jgi:integrase